MGVVCAVFFCLYALFVISYVKLKKAKKKRLRASLLVCPIPSAAFILCQLLFIDYLRLIGRASGLSGIFDPRSVMPLSRLIIGPEYGLPEKYLLIITVLLYTAFIGFIVFFILLITENFIAAKRKLLL